MSRPARFEERLLLELQSVVAARPAPAPTTRSEPTAIRRRARVATAALAVAAAAVAAVVILAAGGGAAKAYAIATRPDGGVTVRIRSLRDADGLQRALRAAGVPAVVDYAPGGPATCRAPAGAEPAAGGAGPSLRTGTEAGRGPSTQSAGADEHAPAAAAQGRMSGSVAMGADGVTFTIDTHEIPAGEQVYITTSSGTVDSVAMAIGAARCG